MTDLYEKMGVKWVEFDQNGRIIAVKGVCKARDFKHKTDK